ncbi:MAG: hypothetical protein B7Z55_11630 [Planctomycetales bacterium 12-60-4]|nr:MAG: hypothetical protein B7Z55_11630 [Planctomycetales bacterium 12-60-4]
MFTMTKPRLLPLDSVPLLTALVHCHREQIREDLEPHIVTRYVSIHFFSMMHRIKPNYLDHSRTPKLIVLVYSPITKMILIHFTTQLLMRLAEIILGCYESDWHH